VKVETSEETPGEGIIDERGENESGLRGEVTTVHVPYVLYLYFESRPRGDTTSLGDI
jgi:hypothetical protein